MHKPRDLERRPIRLTRCDASGSKDRPKWQLAKRQLLFGASALLLAGGLLTGAARPAAALSIAPFAAFPTGIIQILCSYGTPHCVNPSPGPNRPKVGGEKFPDSGWTDSDCKYYGNCDTGTSPQNWGDPTISRRGPSRLGRSGAMQPVHMGSPRAK